MTASTTSSLSLSHSDYALAQRAGAGDLGAFRTIYDNYHRRVFCLVLRLASDVETASDVTQEVFIQLWKSINNFRGDSQFSTWLHTVATRVAITELRKQQRRLQQLHFANEEQQLLEQRLEHQESPDLSLLDVLIQRLAPQTRWVFVLHCLEGMRHEDVAEELGIAVGTSKAQVHRARQLLEGWLGDDSTN